MARTKTEKKYSDFLGPLDVSELKILISEAQAALKAKEMETSLTRRLNDAILLRNSLNIGGNAYFVRKKIIHKGSVLGITEKKVRIKTKADKPINVDILKLLSVNNVDKLVESGKAFLHADLISEQTKTEE